jgi:PIN domain nuclease of toxin-antitoxin system
MRGDEMLLLDTHALIWLVEGSKPLGRRAARLADDALARDQLAVAAISFWEVAMLAREQRIALDLPPAEWRLRVVGLGVHEVPLTGDVAIAAAMLTDFHADPADRLIVTSAQAMDAGLITADERILRWRGPLVRHDARR